MVSPQTPDSTVDTTTIFVTVSNPVFNNITTILLENLSFQLTFITAFQPKCKYCVIYISFPIVSVKIFYVYMFYVHMYIGNLHEWSKHFNYLIV